MIRQLVTKWFVWLHAGGNLLEEDIDAELHIVIPRVGQPKLFATKMDGADVNKVLKITQAAATAAFDHARFYGLLDLAGVFGKVNCPHCGKLVNGPPQPPPR